ncbi:hypothetical protein Tco_0974216 [Tanacetum coccineum]|uniref:Xylulose kinase-1 n=1 Tax=Tanacetum coccineum TaxID=301880 RepID=A0ABQ5EAY5_9ASTR
MADLKFVDQHNMVAYLEKSDENAEFHQIVDFLSTRLINYALTVSPTIYASYIEQFWNTATSKIVNSVKQIHAIVDGNAVVIPESSVRNNLLFDDEDGITCLINDDIFENLALMRNFDPKKFLMYPRFLQLFLNNQLKDLPEPFNDTYETPSHTRKVFSNMARQSKKFSGKVTPLFESMLVQNQAPEVSHEPQTQANIEQILPSPSTYQRKLRKTQKYKRAKKVTKLPQTSVPLDLGADKTTTMPNVDIPQGMDTGGSPRRQETMGGAPAQTRSERVLKQPNESPFPEGHTSGSGEGRMEHTFELMDIIPSTPHDSPLQGGYTPGSDEGRLKLKELMAICTKLSKQVLDLEKENDAQAVKILKLKKRVKKLERQRKSSISHPRKRIYRQVESSDDSLDEEDASNQGRKSDKIKPMFKESDFDDIDDLVDEGMVFVQEKDAETQGKIGSDDTEVVKGSGDTEVLDIEKAVNTADEGVSTASVYETVSTAAPRTHPTTTTVFDDEDVTMDMAQTLIKIKEEKAKEKGVVITDETESVEKTKKKVQGDAQMERDVEVALRLQAELDEELRAPTGREREREQFTIKERAQFFVKTIAAQRKFRAAQRAVEIKSKPPTKTQLRNMMITYLKNMGKFNHNQLKGKSYEELQRLYEREQKWIHDFVPMDSKKEDKKSVEPESEGKKGKRIKRVADSTLK